MKRTLIFVAMLFSFFMIGWKEFHSRPEQQDRISTGKKWLALGDSYTIGESVEEQERYPVQVVKMLNDTAAVYASPEIIARTGWTTSDLLYSLQRSKPGFDKYDVVTLLIGVNNQYQGLPIGQYRQEFQSLLEKAIAYAGNDKKHVIVLSVPDYSVTPYAENSDRKQIAGEIDAFNQVNKELSNSAGVNYIDITTGSRKAKSDRSLIADDGLHPSGKMYGQWAELLIAQIRKIPF